MVYAYDTYFFKVDLTTFRQKALIDAYFENQGNRDTQNPFYSLWVYPQVDTNCVVVQFTPINDVEDTLAKTGFGLSYVHLRKQLHIEPGQEPQTILDDTLLYPVNYNWSIHSSTG